MEVNPPNPEVAVWKPSHVAAREPHWGFGLSDKKEKKKKNNHTAWYLSSELSCKECICSPLTQTNPQTSPNFEVENEMHISSPPFLK